MSKTYYKTGSVPTVRYRVLAIVFFLLAVAGLLLGFLTKIPVGFFQKYFAHSPVELAEKLNLADVEGAILPGTLLGYSITVLKLFFTTGLSTLKGMGVFAMLREIAAVLQAALFPAAVLVSLALGITACLTKHGAARNCAMTSGYFLLATYLWPALSVLFLGQGAGPSFPLLGFKFSVDVIIDGIALITLVLLCVVTICRRKLVGFLRVLSLILLLAAAVTLCCDGIFYTNVNAVVTKLSASGIQGFGVISYFYLALTVLLGVTIAFYIFRLNAKRFYPVEAVLSGIDFVLVAAIFVYFIFRGYADFGGSRWLIFTQKPVLAAILLGGTLIVFVLSILNVFLIIRRRNVMKAKRIAAELAEDSIDKEFDREESYAGQPAEQPAYTAPAEPYQVAPQQPYAAPAGYGYAPAPYPQPAYQQPAYPQPAYQQPAYPQPMPGPMGPVYPPVAPVIVQQAPATPPVIVLQVPPYGGQQGYQQTVVQPQYPGYSAYPAYPAYTQPQPAPVQQPAQQSAPVQQPAQQPAPAAETAVVPAEPEQARVQPTYVHTEAPLSDFAKRMMVLADEDDRPVPQQPAQAQTARVPAPVPAEAEASGVHTEEAHSYVGPHDSFIDSLTDSEQKEFREIFIEKKHGDLGLPKYEAGKDNKEFFTKVFSALGKFRPYASNGLLDKLLANAN